MKSREKELEVAWTARTTAGGPGPAFARAVLDAAAEVEAAEARIREELRRAARASDIPRILDILERWANQSAIEVLRAIGLDPCGKPEVQDKRRPEGGV